VGLGIAWLLGILLDLLNGTLLGEHALALSVVVYLALKLQRQARFFPWWQLALIVGILVFIYQFILFLIQGLTGQAIVQWQYWYASFSSLIIWPFVYYVLHRLNRRHRLH
jgi:rod shape-determining protein MreD